MRSEQGPVPRRHLEVLAVAVPVLVLLAGAWSRRWLADDGFINLRIVEQIWAGNGPVWNATERVETGTSPLWLAVLAVAGSVLGFVDLEWVAVLLGIGATAGGLTAASLAARRLHGGSGAPLVPLGALVVAAVPAFWDFSSSGLETGLSFLWLGTSGWALAAAARAPIPSTARVLATGVLLGLGPLVRPDLALVAMPLLVALLLVAGRSLPRSRLVLLPVAAGAAPVAFQVFRMAYFASLVPNTAFAKEGALASWDAGWSYAGDHVGTWRLWWPAAVLVVVALALVVRRPAGHERRSQLVMAALAGGALLHALYVIRVGGDFMHARLLLPATFAVVLPWAVVPARPVVVVAAVALVPWAVLAATTWAPPAPGQGPARGVIDERAYYVALAGRANPVTVEDFADVPYTTGGRLAAATAQEGRGNLTFRITTPDDRSGWVAAADGSAPLGVAVDNVGVFGYLAGPDVSVLDLRGLGDPVTSRFRLVGPRGRPGHEKTGSPPWLLARHAATGASPPSDVVAAPEEVAAARAALACGDLAAVLEGISAPLSAGRAAENLVLALTTSDLRLSVDPAAARDELCGS